MTRVRFDPTFFEDERWERLGAEAVVLHLAAVSFTVRTLSDGVISRGRVRTLTPLVEDAPAVADRLLADGLWTDLGSDGLRVCEAHDDLRRSDGRGDEQPSAAFVQGDRERARKRKETWQQKRNAGGNGVPCDVRNAAHSSAVRTSAVQDPKGPSPALHEAETPALASRPDICPDRRCDGTGWIEAEGGTERRCATPLNSPAHYRLQAVSP